MGEGAGDLVLAADEVARPAASGVNENGLRHFGQKPSVRPGWPSRERPTGDSQTGQLRRSSGTIGFFMIALEASTAGTGGIEVRPAPSRAPRNRVEEVPTRRVILVPPAAARAEPSAVDASRLEAREDVDAVWADAGREVGGRGPDRSGRAAGGIRSGRPADVAVAVDDGAGAARLGAGAGRDPMGRRRLARLPADGAAGDPQTSQ